MFYRQICNTVKDFFKSLRVFRNEKCIQVLRQIERGGRISGAHRVLMRNDRKPHRHHVSFIRPTPECRRASLGHPQPSPMGLTTWPSKHRKRGPATQSACECPTGCPLRENKEPLLVAGKSFSSWAQQELLPVASPCLAHRGCSTSPSDAHWSTLDLTVASVIVPHRAPGYGAGTQ